MADKGILIPFQFNDAGGIAEADAITKAKINILSVISTIVGTRINESDYGSTIPSLLSDPNDTESISIAQKEVREKVNAWYPSVEILEVGIESIQDVFYMLIKYKEKTLQVTDQMLVEF